VETGLGSSHRNVEHLGDLCRFESEVVVKHEHSSLIDA
jgi:hypothetical protein